MNSGYKNIAFDNIEDKTSSESKALKNPKNIWGIVVLISTFLLMIGAAFLVFNLLFFFQNRGAFTRWNSYWRWIMLDYIR